MPRKTQRELQAARNVQSVDPSQPRWFPPRAEDCEHPPPVKTYLSSGYVVIPRQMFFDGDLVGYAVVLAVGAEEVEVFSIDTTNHGSVHSHEGPHDATSLTEIMPIFSQQDVDHSYWDSVARVFEHYDLLTSS